MRPKILLAGRAAAPFAESPSVLSLHNPVFLKAGSGSETFMAMLKHRPRLVLVSADLPEIPGADLARFVRSDQELKRTSLIVLGGSRPVPHANATFPGEFSLEEVAERSDRLLGIQPRVTARTSVCLGRRLLDRTTGSLAHAINLSESGMLVDCRETLGLGEDLWLHFLLPRHLDLIAARGRVVRTAELTEPPAPTRRAPRGFGLEFTSLRAEDQLRIRQFVQHPA